MCTMMPKQAEPVETVREAESPQADEVRFASETHRFSRRTDAAECNYTRVNAAPLAHEVLFRKIGKSCSPRDWYVRNFGKLPC